MNTVKYFIIHRLLVYWYYFISKLATNIGLYDTDLYYRINSWSVKSAELDIDRILWLPKIKNVKERINE